MHILPYMYVNKQFIYELPWNIEGLRTIKKKSGTIVLGDQIEQVGGKQRWEHY